MRIIAVRLALDFVVIGEHITSVTVILGFQPNTDIVLWCENFIVEFYFCGRCLFVCANVKLDRTHTIRDLSRLYFYFLFRSSLLYTDQVIATKTKTAQVKMLI